MKKITIGITAHVDSGKTTLSEAILYTAGSTKRIGRVDNGDSSLDTNFIERERGITVFAHQAEFEVNDTHFYLLDTPGHTDFSCETERTMQVLDYAVLVISGTDGVQSHTFTIWKLLEKYKVPVFIFVNKMDLKNADRNLVCRSIQERLSHACADFSEGDIYENSALCSEELMEKYLDGGLSDCDIIQGISERKIYPVFFGSALKMQGIDRFIRIISRFSREPQRRSEFGAKVYKISYDSKGNRLTHLKVTGGSIEVREEIEYKGHDGGTVRKKVSTIRFCSGDKFRTEKKAEAGDVCAVTGLDGTYSGQGIGSEENLGSVLLEPVMKYKVNVPESINIHDALKDFRVLEEQDPQLHIVWSEQNKQIHIYLMGMVQTEVVTEIVKARYGYEVSFSDGAVTYRESILRKAEGAGHYEPLKHYAEVHLLLEPLERGRGLVIDSICSEDVLNRNWQRLILTHLGEKIHRGTLTGSPITDMRIRLVSGKAHLKHTEGGDFRQAVYRAVRNGLMHAGCVLLEPYYNYELEVPSQSTGRAISDLQRMNGEFSPPETYGNMSIIRGKAPVSELNGYSETVLSYTGGNGRLVCTLCGYFECHNAEEVIKSIGYNCEGDTENTADSVFCSHGSGYVVKWTEAEKYMHLPSVMEKENGNEFTPPVKRTYSREATDEELKEIFERTYGKSERDARKMFKKSKAEKTVDSKVRLPKYVPPDYLIVDGYNIIFSWDELKKLAEENIDASKSLLIDMMCSYQGYRKCKLILVFDSYKVKGGVRNTVKHYNIDIVYTKEGETADTYIERITHELSEKHRVTVATSDGWEQSIVFGNGAMRISSREFHDRYLSACAEMKEYMG